MIKTENEISAIVDSMNEEQLKDCIKICNAIDIFSREMKIRFAEKVAKGKKGWNDTNVYPNCADEVIERGERMLKGDGLANIGAVNFAFIDWYNTNKHLIV